MVEQNQLYGDGKVVQKGVNYKYKRSCSGSGKVYLSLAINAVSQLCYVSPIWIYSSEIVEGNVRELQNYKITNNEII